MSDSLEENSELSLFDKKQLRRIWHKGEWYYSITDVIGILTDSKHPSSYWTTIKNRIKNEGFQETLGQIESVRLKAQDGRLRQAEVVNRPTLLRIIQSIPSPNAETFRNWLAQVGEERFEEIENPQAALDRVRELYRAKGYDNTWIEERIKNDIVRNELTDEWKARGAKEGLEYAILTNEISSGTFGLTVQSYKEFKALPAKENLRDHMSTIELILCSLGEATATLYHQDRNSQGFKQLKEDARDAGITAGKAREVIETDLKRPVISRTNHLELTKGSKKSGQKVERTKKQMKTPPQLEMSFEDGSDNSNH